MCNFLASFGDPEMAPKHLSHLETMLDLGKLHLTNLLSNYRRLVLAIHKNEETNSVLEIHGGASTRDFSLNN